MGSFYKIICCLVIITPLLSKAVEYTDLAVEQKNIFPRESIVDEQTLELVTGLAKPPFILEDQQHGLQLDLIREAFASENYNVNFNAMPLGRNLTGFRRMNADGIITLPPSYEHPALFISKPYIIYQNVAVSLSEDNFKIEQISELSDKSIIAFQNAKKFLGDEYEGTIAYSMDYREVPDQMKQIELLFLRRTEVIILDINIFKYFVKTQKNPLFNKPYTVHYIFNERPYSVGFKSNELKETFDKGIETIKENGTYQLVIDNYLN
ncbi:transporter substrate-binding domain-containing protein [Thalassotalea sp. SU-HH00458]|uniref:substrate-binding periplasmic protein n=1 Tax=Thalassotalea sp. SU-HH00458 TaxID=3127657 RepID=UPI00310312AB